MSAPSSALVAWKTGPRTFSTWHVVGDDLWVTLCGCAVPQKPLTNVTRIRGGDRRQTCLRCCRELDNITAANVRLV